jgi:hypothetical protein
MAASVRGLPSVPVTLAAVECFRAHRVCVAWQRGGSVSAMTTGYDADLPPAARAALDAARTEMRDLESAAAAQIAEIEAGARASTQAVRARLESQLRDRRALLHALLKPMQDAAMRAGDLDGALAIREHARALAPSTGAATQPAPTNLVAFASDGVGKTFSFELVGALSGPVWGTDEYTLDSHVAVAAVHAGVVRDGERAIVRVTLFDTTGRVFTGSLRNGVQSFNWTSYPIAYRFLA